MITFRIYLLTLLSVFQQSVIVEVTNPKTALFFIALLPQFVVPESGPVSQQLLILGIIVTISALPCDIFVAVSSSKISNWLLKHERAQLYIENIQDLYPQILKKQPKNNEEVLIEPIGNHSRGTTFLNANHLINQDLAQENHYVIT